MLVATEKSVIHQMAQQEKEHKEKLELERLALEEQERAAAERVQIARREAQLAREAAEAAASAQVPRYSQHDGSIENYQRQRGLLYRSADDEMPAEQVGAELSIFSAVFSTATAARGIEEHGNKILLPSSVLEKLISARVRTPYMFELCNATLKDADSAPAKVIVSVLDFASANEAAYAPHWVLERLGVDEGSRIALRTVSLEKGTFATIQPLQFEWILIPEEHRRGVLEAQLRKYQALSVGEVVSIEHLKQAYKFEIVDLQPASSVSIIDSDLECDILPPVDTARYQHTSLLLSEDQPKITVTLQLSTEVPRLFFKTEISDPNANYFVSVESESVYPILFFMDTKRPYPTKFDNKWSSEKVNPDTHTSSDTPTTPGVYINPRSNSKTVVVNHLDAHFASGTLYIGVWASPSLSSSSSSIGRLTIGMEPFTSAASSSSSSGASYIVGDTNASGAVQCDNCLRIVPSATFMMHSAQCARRNWRCKACNLVVPVEDRAKHEQTAHGKLKCDQCGLYEGESIELELHKTYECRNRPFECPYCHLNFPYSQRGTHLRECGTRTSKCDSCGKFFKNEEMKRHAVEAHAVQQTD